MRKYLMANGGAYHPPGEGVAAIHECRRNDDAVDEVMQKITDLCGEE